ncbi:MAG: DJ-1/PfpI family protein [Moheibacter sp.]
MKSLRTVMGFEPTHEIGEIYSPSKTALKSAVKDKTEYDYTTFDNPCTENNLKVLIIGTEKEHLEMENGKIFLTGNHPVELFVPMLHLKKAGFDFDFATPTGKSLKLEHWAMPKDDSEVLGIYDQYKSKIEKPFTLTQARKNTQENPYVAIFIPGGHGAVMDLPDNLEVKEIIQWAQKNNKLILSICHGPAAFLSATIGEDKESFTFNGYKIAAFPDGMDRLLPSMGYLPGRMPLYFGEKLQEFGVDIINKFATGNVVQDRNLITGDSPKAANKLGKLAAIELLKQIYNKEYQYAK